MGPLRTRAVLLVSLALALLGGQAGAESNPPDRPPGVGAVCEPAPDCRAACYAEARQVWRACGETGESRRECRARARVHRIACLESECRPEPSCEDRCGVRAAELLRRCLADGGSAEPCRRDAEDARDACIYAQCRPHCICPRVYAPVCGVDGVTYPNICDAQCAGVEIAHEGNCRPQCRPVVCQLFCEHGFAVDDRGCEVCKCAPPPGPPR